MYRFLGRGSNNNNFTLQPQIIKRRERGGEEVKPQKLKLFHLSTRILRSERIAIEGTLSVKKKSAESD